MLKLLLNNRVYLYSRNFGPNNGAIRTTQDYYYRNNWAIGRASSTVSSPPCGSPFSREADINNYLSYPFVQTTIAEAQAESTVERYHLGQRQLWLEQWDKQYSGFISKYNATDQLTVDVAKNNNQITNNLNNFNL